MASTSKSCCAGLLLAATFAGSSALAADDRILSMGGDQTTTLSSSQAAAAWRTGRGLFFKRNWGVEIIGVKPAASGYMLTLRYRVLDARKAKVMNDRRSKAYLIDESTGIALAVPALENVGELRPGSAVEADRNYFMVFGNPGKLVKSGSRVTLVAGNLRAAGIVVD